MNLDTARSQMVEQQVRSWDVLDPRVLSVLGEVPRENFVPERYRRLAFADTAIPLGHGQVMMAPKVEGRVLQALDLRADDTILEIGTGSGFLTACLARLGGSLTSLEIHEPLSARAAQRLDTADVRGVTLEVADASMLEERARYDAIAVTPSLPVYDPRFEQALRVGGRLFVVVGAAPVMEARLVTRIASAEWTVESLFETVVPPMVNAVQADTFEW